MKKLICMTCYKSTASGICAAGYDDPDKCNNYQKQFVCPNELAFEDPYNCYKCAKTCSGCFEMRIKFGFITRDKVAHLL